MLARLFQNLPAALLLMAGAPLGAAGVSPIPIPQSESAPGWEGPQFVQADRAGRVYFLRANTLEVFPLDKAGQFTKPVRLDETAVEKGRVLRATLSPSGDRWLLYGGFAVRHFVDGKEKALPSLDWNPWGVGFLRDTPVVAVIPRRLDRHETDPAELAKAPWLLSLSGDRWSPLKGLPGDDLSKALAAGGLNRAIEESAVLLQSDKEGKLWVARQYAYRVQRLNASGRILLDIAVERGKTAREPAAKGGIEIKLHAKGENPTEATRSAGEEKGRFFAFTAKPVILGLAPSPDGRTYFLVSTEEGAVALDRYDPALANLERLQLAFKPPGALSMAAGRDALYLAATEGGGGRWRIPWDDLERSSWKLVRGAEIDGLKLEGQRQPALGAGRTD